MKRFAVLLLILGMALSSCTAFGKMDGDNQDIGLSEGKAAPNFTLKDIDGRDVNLSDYRGKIVIVNFFGVWCPWCVREMPGFVRVYNEYKDKNVELLVVDVGDTKVTVQNYLKENNYSIKPVMDDGQKVSSLYQVSGYPTTYIIDEDGIIRRVHRAYMDENSLKGVLNGLIQK